MSDGPLNISPVARAVKLIVFEIVLLAAVLLAIFVYLPTLVTELEPEQEPATEIDEPAAPIEVDPEETVAELDDVDPADRGVIATHSVESSDTLWDLSENYWGSRHLWPDLYEWNSDSIDDPDHLQIGTSLRIPESLMQNATLGERAREHLMDAYVVAYQAYRDIGATLRDRARITGRRDLDLRSRLKYSKAQWLLYSGTRFDADYIATRSAAIHASDIEAVTHFLERFGRPPLE